MSGSGINFMKQLKASSSSSQQTSQREAYEQGKGSRWNAQTWDRGAAGEASSRATGSWSTGVIASRADGGLGSTSASHAGPSRRIEPQSRIQPTHPYLAAATASATRVREAHQTGLFGRRIPGSGTTGSVGRDAFSSSFGVESDDGMGDDDQTLDEGSEDGSVDDTPPVPEISMGEVQRDLESVARSLFSGGGTRAPGGSLASANRLKKLVVPIRPRPSSTPVEARKDTSSEDDDEEGGESDASSYSGGSGGRRTSAKAKGKRKAVDPFVRKNPSPKRQRVIQQEESADEAGGYVLEEPEVSDEYEEQVAPRDERHHRAPLSFGNFRASDVTEQMHQLMSTPQVNGNQQTMVTDFGTITLARPVKSLMDKAAKIFKCGESDLRECKGCEVRITDKTTAELQPEMVGMIKLMFEEWGSADFFFKCFEAERFFNETILPIYNARLDQINQGARQNQVSPEFRAMMANDPTLAEDESYMMAALKNLSVVGDAAAGGSQATPTEHPPPTGHVAAPPTLPTELPQNSDELAVYINTLLNASKRPLTKWRARSIFDHFVLHVKMPLVAELILAYQLHDHIQTLDGLQFVEMPGPGGTFVREYLWKNGDMYLKYLKTLTGFHDRLQKVLEQGAHVSTALHKGFSTSAIVNNAWSLPYTEVAKVDALYGNT